MGFFSWMFLMEATNKKNEGGGCLSIFLCLIVLFLVVTFIRVFWQILLGILLIILFIRGILFIRSSNRED